GYAVDQTKNYIDSDKYLTVTLFEEVLTLDEFTLKGQGLEGDLKSTQMGVSSLSIEKIEKIPSFMGEPDVISSITLLPGVSSVGDGVGGGFNVRGGASDQNLILLDGAP